MILKLSITPLRLFFCWNTYAFLYDVLTLIERWPYFEQWFSIHLVQHRLVVTLKIKMCYLNCTSFYKKTILYIILKDHYTIKTLQNTKGDPERSRQINLLIGKHILIKFWQNFVFNLQPKFEKRCLFYIKNAGIFHSWKDSSNKWIMNESFNSYISTL